jgi:GxxExxY protein
MDENDLAKIVVDLAFKIHTRLGPGLFESIYEEILYYELEKMDLRVTRQQDLPVFWEGKKMEVGFRTDLVIENKIIVEIKSIEVLAPVHHKQLLTYFEIDWNEIRTSDQF